MKNRLVVFIIAMFAISINAQENFMRVEISPRQEEHAHGGTIVELPNGDMLAAWFRGMADKKQSCICW